MADPLVHSKEQTCPILRRSTAYVLIVEPASSIRMMMIEILRAMGFERFQMAANIKEALHYLETEDVHWLITPFLFDQPLHALNLLHLITRTVELKSVAVSLFVTEAEFPYLCQAFELGALSWHPRGSARESLQSEFEGLLQNLERHGGQMAFTAAEYLRSFLLSRRYYRSLLHLEEELLSLRPGYPRQMLALAEAQLSLGKLEKGHSLLAQVVSIDESLKSAAALIAQRFPAQNSVSAPFKSVVIIDPDSNHRHALEGLLRKIAVLEPQSFEDGQTAFDWISEHDKVDLIIMEWKIPGMPGLVLLQRIRKQLKLKAMIVVVSSLLKASEKPLLKEMGVDELFEKPLDTASFLGRLLGGMQHKSYSSRLLGLETKIRRLLLAKRVEEALVDLPALLDNPKVQDSIKRELLAEIDYQNGKYSEALALAIEALKLEGGHTLGLLNLAGKCFLKLHQFQSAIKCFERAKDISPMNFERLFDLAECKLAVEEPKAVAENLRVVNEFDPGNPQLLEIQTKVDLELGDKTSPLLEALDPAALKRIASFINNRGVILVRSGRIEEGIGLYERALKALPVKAISDRSLVTYNLALASARHGDFEPAMMMLDLIPSAKNATSPQAYAIFKKTRALKKRIEMLIAKGEKAWPVSDDIAEEGLAAEAAGMSEPPQASGGKPRKPNPNSWDAMMEKTIFRKGDLGCYQIFRYIDEDKSQVADRLQTTIRFVKR